MNMKAVSIIYCAPLIHASDLYAAAAAALQAAILYSQLSELYATLTVTDT